MELVRNLRVSTEEQARLGLGLYSQRATIQAEGGRRGWAVRWVVDDGYSLVALDLGIDTTTPAGELVANVMVPSLSGNDASPVNEHATSWLRPWNAGACWTSVPAAFQRHYQLRCGLGGLTRRAIAVSMTTRSLRPGCRQVGTVVSCTVLERAASTTDL